MLFRGLGAGRKETPLKLTRGLIEKIIIENSAKSAAIKIEAMIKVDREQAAKRVENILSRLEDLEQEQAS